MKVDLNEIWEFMDMAPQPKTADKGDQWLYELVAGSVRIKNLKSSNITNLKKEENYDTELLPSIFTFREILWQPNVYTQPALCVPQLNILKVFCQEYVEEMKETHNGDVWPYFNLLNGLAAFCDQALKKISSDKKKDIRISSILGDLRKQAFPIVKFFIFHPMNRRDYQRDALNRLNYAVKIMLTQYNNKYYELQDPFWNVTVGKPSEISMDVASEEAIPKETDSKENAAPNSSLATKGNVVKSAANPTLELGTDHQLEEF